MSEQNKQEPVAWMYPDDLERFETSETFAQAYSIEMVSPTQGETVPLYTTPQPQRKWVGTVDCIGLALDLEAQAKRVESQTVERAMLAAANCLRIIDKESKT